MVLALRRNQRPSHGTGNMNIFAALGEAGKKDAGVASEALAGPVYLGMHLIMSSKVPYVLTQVSTSLG